MSDKLVERLREEALGPEGVCYGDTHLAAADRIEELEGALERAKNLIENSGWPGDEIARAWAVVRGIDDTLNRRQ